MLENICKQAIESVKSTGEFIRKNIGKVTDEDVLIKGKNSLVSYVDKEAEKMLVKDLRKLLPQAVFFTEEETTINKQGEWQWIIDPLDGTTNFLFDVPIFSVSVALRHHEEVVIGIVYHIVNDEIFHAIKGKGAFLNNHPISVADRPPEEGLLATGFPYSDFTYMNEYLSVLRELMQRTRGLRRLGSAAIDLAYVAAGKFDVFFEYGLNAWDVAAGVLLVQEAGGIVSDFNKGDDFLFGKQIVAGSPSLYHELIDLIEEHLGTDIHFTA